MSYQFEDWSKYKAMQTAGQSPQFIYQVGRSDDLDYPTAIRMLRSLFGSDLTRAKEVTIQADRVTSTLSDYQESLFPILERALAEVETDQTMTEDPNQPI